MTKSSIFHVQENILIQNGFVKSVTDDKDSPKDTINTLRFTDFTKKIGEDLLIVVSYNYTTKDEKVYELHSSAVELNVNDGFTAIPINKLSDLLTLILILEGNE